MGLVPQRHILAFPNILWLAPVHISRLLEANWFAASILTEWITLVFSPYLLASVMPQVNQLFGESTLWTPISVWFAKDNRSLTMLPESPPAYPDPLVLPGFLVPNNFTWPSLTAIKFLSWQASIYFLVLPGACPNLRKSLGFGLMASDNTRLKTFYFRSVLTACFFFFFSSLKQSPEARRYGLGIHILNERVFIQPCFLGHQSLK